MFWFSKIACRCSNIYRLYAASVPFMPAMLLFDCFVTLLSLSDSKFNLRLFPPCCCCGVAILRIWVEEADLCEWSLKLLLPCNDDAELGNNFESGKAAHLPCDMIEFNEFLENALLRYQVSRFGRRRRNINLDNSYVNTPASIHVVSWWCRESRGSDMMYSSFYYYYYL